ncbi:hypothetical protein [Absidia glauca]|uniref:Uncharacterized protein n=1 Tax=Absidia glauca TaxID=4829 RepID=A0A168NMH8_ABSGL|nr:hypothetical protein [Absidia glauca]
MEYNWSNTEENQEHYLRTMVVEHYSEYAEQAFTERHFSHLKKKTMMTYLAPTLVDLFHLLFPLPITEQEQYEYKEQRTNLVRELLGKKTTGGRIRLLLKKADTIDDWTNEGHSFPRAEDVAVRNMNSEIELFSDIFGLDQLVNWASQ